MSTADDKRVAEDLGAEVIEVSAPDSAEVIAQVVRDRRVTLLVISAPEPRRRLFRARPSLASRLQQLKLTTNIMVIPCQREE